ncbi:MAG TPA: ribonuclease HII [Terriglobia bacterium]|nr:ribonuclease HII [Terriglobia bacterium]
MRSRGYTLVAGCDEAGRGSLIGPLFAAAVILDPMNPIDGLDDSKKLTAETRSRLDLEIRSKALAFQIVAISARQIEANNVYQASRQAMLQALRALHPAPDFVLTDAMPLHVPGGRRFPIPHTPLVHGDARSVSIAAASILAKVARDALMVDMGIRYPQYNLASNKGYATPDHLESIRVHGPCPEHRRTFSPVRDLDLPLFGPTRVKRSADL